MQHKSNVTSVPGSFRFVSGDIETSGTDSRSSQTLEIAFVFDDWDRPRPIRQLSSIRMLVDHPEITFRGSDGLWAATHHTELLAEMERLKRQQEEEQRQGRTPFWAKPGTIEILRSGKGQIDLGLVPVTHACTLLAEWFRPLGSDTTLAGKNFGSFDLQFLEELPQWNALCAPLFRHAVLDIGSLWFDPLQDKSVPSTTVCRERSGIGTGECKHRALDDARDGVAMIRKRYGIEESNLSQRVQRAFEAPDSVPAFRLETPTVLPNFLRTAESGSS